MSLRTPTSGTIKMSDLDKSNTLSWSSNRANQSLEDYKMNDFASYGFAYCYGNPGTSNPSKLSNFYDILGYVTYTVTSSSVQAQSVTVDITAGNGSNGTAPGSIILAYPIDLPSNPGGVTADGAHWETAIITVNAQIVTQPFDVYFDGNHLGTIPNDGVYMYDNGGLGYANGYAGSGRVYVDLIG
jgi:hypothetical protein